MKKLLYIVSLTITLNLLFSCSPESLPEDKTYNDNLLQDTPKPNNPSINYHGDEDKDKDTKKP
jgi:hypothetical protein